MPIFHIIDNQSYFFQSHEDGNNLEKIKVKKKNKLEVNSAWLSIIMKNISEICSIFCWLNQKLRRGSPAIQLRSIGNPCDCNAFEIALPVAIATFLEMVSPPAACVNLHWYIPWSFCSPCITKNNTPLSIPYWVFPSTFVSATGQ